MGTFLASLRAFPQAASVRSSSRLAADGVLCFWCAVSSLNLKCRGSELHCLNEGALPFASSSLVLMCFLLSISSTYPGSLYLCNMLIPVLPFGSTSRAVPSFCSPDPAACSVVLAAPDLEVLVSLYDTP